MLRHCEKARMVVLAAIRYPLGTAEDQLHSHCYPTPYCDSSQHDSTPQQLRCGISALKSNVGHATEVKKYRMDVMPRTKQELDDYSGSIHDQAH